MSETRTSVRVWCYFLRPSLLRRPGSTAPLCSTLLNSAAQLCSTQLCSTQLCSALLNSAQLLCFIGSAQPEDTEHLSAPASSQLPASAPPRHVLSRHRCAAPVVLTSIHQHCATSSSAAVSRGVVVHAVVLPRHPRRRTTAPRRSHSASWHGRATPPACAVAAPPRRRRCTP